MSPDSMDEQQLMEGIVRGDEECLHQLYMAYETRLYRFAMTRLGEPLLAADVVNDVMLQVWRSAEKFAGRSRLSTWIFGIANHKILDHLRSKHKNNSEELGEHLPDESVLDLVRQVELSQKVNFLQYCMQQLSTIQQQVLELTFLENYSYQDIAEILDCPQGTVKTRVFKARKLLKSCFNRLTGGVKNEPV